MERYCLTLGNPHALKQHFTASICANKMNKHSKSRMKTGLITFSFIALISWIYVIKAGSLKKRKLTMRLTH